MKVLFIPLYIFLCWISNPPFFLANSGQCKKKPSRAYNCWILPVRRPQINDEMTVIVPIFGHW